MKYVLIGLAMTSFVMAIPGIAVALVAWVLWSIRSADTHAFALWLLVAFVVVFIYRLVLETREQWEASERFVQVSPEEARRQFANEWNETGIER